MNSLNIRQMIREFNHAFGRPVHSQIQGVLSPEDRELLGKLLLEEVLEYCQKGLGLKLATGCYDVSDQSCYTDDSFETLKPGFAYLSDVDAIVNVADLSAQPGVGMDVVEAIDGLADVQVVAHFNAHWHGFNLDYATAVVHASNMSKLDDDSKAIINGVTPGYRGPSLDSDSCVDLAPESGYDPNKPIGKILKSKNFFEPVLGPVIQFGNPPYNPGDNVGQPVETKYFSVDDGYTPLLNPDDDHIERRYGDDISKPFESNE